MAFQDFGQVSERRRAEKQQKLKKRLTIAAVSSCGLLLLVAAGVFAFVQVNSNNNNAAGNHSNSSNKGHSTAASGGANNNDEQLHTGTKAIETLCNLTDYKASCKDSLTKYSANHSVIQPKDLLKAAINVVSIQLDNVLKNTSSFKFEKPEEQAAFEDCKVLLKDAREELNSSVARVDGKMASKGADLNNWLSAVMSYQQTCIDGFPEGELKTDMEKVMNSSKEFTSNALAIVSEVSSILAKINIPGITSRRLMGKEESDNVYDKLPSWMTHEDRRILAGRGDKPTPNVVVAKDGSGQFATISAALAAMPAKYQGRYVIYVKEGVYDETVTVDKQKENVTLYGDGSQKSIITGNKNFVDGVRTFQTASFVALGDGFMAQAIGFRNTAGPEKHQAVAVRVQSDRAIFLNCRMEGYQDTLYAQTHRQFYRSCVISGTVDFIFGDAAAVFQNCLITVRKPLDNQQNIVTAQGRVDRRETTGIVLQNCRIVADEKLVPVKATIKSYLGRPWKEFSRTIVMDSTIDDLIHPDGWLPWEGDFGLKTLYYAEFNNKGAGAATDKRVKWEGVKKITKEVAATFTVDPFLQGDWITASGAPVHFGLF